MTDLPYGVDPSPHEELPSDIAFRLWLEGLKPGDLTDELDPPEGTIEERWTAAARARQRGEWDVRNGRH